MLYDLSCWSILSVPPSVRMLSVCLSVCMSIYLSICLSVCLPVCLSVRPSVRPSVCLYVLLYACMSVCLSFCMSIRQSVCPSVRSFVRPSFRSSVSKRGRPQTNRQIIPTAGTSTSTGSRTQFSSMTVNNHATSSSRLQCRSTRHQRSARAIVSKISRSRTTQTFKHNHTQFVCNRL